MFTNCTKKRLLNSKVCGEGTGCFKQKYTPLYSNTPNVNSWDDNTEMRKLVLADGTQVSFNHLDPTCTREDSGSLDVCLAIDVNINGEKKPNTVGRDLFDFVLKKNGLYPNGCDIDKCNTTNKNGWACACKVLREGALNY